MPYLLGQGNCTCQPSHPQWRRPAALFTGGWHTATTFGRPPAGQRGGRANVSATALGGTATGLLNATAGQ